MMYILSCIILFILCVIGLTEVAKFIFLNFLKLKNDKSFILISPLNNSDNTEIHLRNCINKIRWMGKLRPERIILLDKGLNENARNICELIRKEYEYIEIMTPYELSEEINSSKEIQYSKFEQ